MKSQKVSVEWLKDHLHDSNLRIVDCQFVFGEPEEGRRLYSLSHLPGAVFFDLEEDLAGPRAEHGGKHPLPDVAQLAEKLGRAGIDQDTVVVAYDSQGSAMVARFWWLMQYLGHQQTYLLDGGITRWTELDLPVTTEVPPTPAAKTFTPHVQHDMVVNIDRVRQALQHKDATLIDSREEKRYLAIEEPLYPVAGHIPGALNHYWKHSLNEDGTWKSVEEQAERFAGIDKDSEVIAYCGSGITACPNIMALQEAGFKNVKLYIGSWSDWISYPENPIATGEEDK
jgi:thiosulfate/3-mercaptopyruvate sulfurtransferase